MHTCNYHCIGETHYDIAYCTKDLSAEQWRTEKLEPNARIQGFEILSVTKLSEWDPMAARLRVMREVGTDRDGNDVIGPMAIKAAYGIRVRFPKEPA